MMERYFSGVFTPEGYESELCAFARSAEIFTYILKGAPGTGKSTLIKALAAEFDDERTVLFCSPSEPQSADGVLFADMSLFVADGSEPNFLEPHYRSVRQKVVSFDQFLDNYRLAESAEKIIAAAAEHRQLFSRCQSYVRAVSALYADTYVLADACVASEKLRAFGGRFLKKYKLPRHAERAGTLEFRRMSALTPSGYLTLAPEGYQTVLLSDRYYAASDRFLRALAEQLTRGGLDVIVSQNALFPFPVCEHLLCPALGLAVLSANPMTEEHLPQVETKPVNMLRFYDEETLSARRRRLRLNENSCAYLLGEAASACADQQSARRRMRRFYTPATDFDAVKEILSSLTAQMTFYRRLRNAAAEDLGDDQI
ncbi:MAG: hypothetical protein QM689_01925 [Oscillospiraceae bacterium]